MVVIPAAAGIVRSGPRTGVKPLALPLVKVAPETDTTVSRVWLAGVTVAALLVVLPAVMVRASGEAVLFAGITADQQAVLLEVGASHLLVFRHELVHHRILIPQGFQRPVVSLHLHLLPGIVLGADPHDVPPLGRRCYYTHRCQRDR